MTNSYLVTFIDHNGKFYKDFQTLEHTKRALEKSHRLGRVIVISCEKLGVIQ